MITSATHAMVSTRTRWALALLALLCMNGIATAQGLAAFPSPYDDDVAPVLTLHNDGAEPVTLDSLAFARVPDGSGSEFLDWYVGISTVVEGDTSRVTIECVPDIGPYPASCGGQDNSLGFVIAPGEQAELDFWLGCGVCRAETSVHRDSLVVYTSIADPIRVWLTVHSKGTSAEATPRDAVIGLRPSVASQRAWVDLETARSSSTRIEVVDQLGRRVLALERPLSTGRQSIPLDVSGLAPGAYVVRVTAGGEVGTARLTVVR